jgi:hypothetical protein
VPHIRAPNDGRVRMRPRHPCGVRPRPSQGAHAYAPLGRARLPSMPPRCRAHPRGRTCPPIAVRTSWPCMPPWRYAPPPCRACLSHPCAPLPCAPPEYKSHKLVVHSTSWASGPLTTERWLTAGCLAGDHSFYIHSHSHAQGCACMHVTFHVFSFLFIVNACQLGGHIKLLASLYTF